MTELRFTTFTDERIDEQFNKIESLSPDMLPEEIMAEFHKITVNRIMPAMIYDETSPEFTLYRITPNYPGFNSQEKTC